MEISSLPNNQNLMNMQFNQSENLNNTINNNTEPARGEQAAIQPSFFDTNQMNDNSFTMVQENFSSESNSLPNYDANTFVPNRTPNHHPIQSNIDNYMNNSNHTQQSQSMPPVYDPTPPPPIQEMYTNTVQIPKETPIDKLNNDENNSNNNESNSLLNDLKMINLGFLLAWPLIYFYTIDYNFIMDNKIVMIGFISTLLCIFRNTLTMKNNNKNDSSNYHSIFVQKGFQLNMTLLCLLIFLYYGTLPKDVNKII